MTRIMKHILPLILVFSSFQALANNNQCIDLFRKDLSLKSLSISAQEKVFSIAHDYFNQSPFVQNMRIRITIGPALKELEQYGVSWNHFYEVLEMLQNQRNENLIFWIRGKLYAEKDLGQNTKIIESKLSELRKLLGNKDINAAFNKAIANKDPNIENVKLLIYSGADINNSSFDSVSRTPLHLAAILHPNADVIKLLLEAGANIHFRDFYDRTALDWAAEANPNPNVLKALIEAGSDVINANKYGYTPLHLAAGNNSSAEVVKLLLEKGANPNTVSIYNESPFHLAARSNPNPEVIKLLLAAGANVFAKSARGETPLELALKGDAQNSEIIELLKAAQSK